MFANNKKKSPSLLYLKIFIILLGFGLRLMDSSSRALWFDEAVEFLAPSAAFDQLAEAEDMLAYLQTQYEIIDKLDENNLHSASVYLLQRNEP